MDNLLRSDLPAAINDRRPGNLGEFRGPITVLYEDISESAFDIKDVKENGGTIKREIHTGDATYLNNCEGEPYNLRFIRYEEFLNQFSTPDGDWSRGLSRPDYLVFTVESDDYIIFHELSIGKFASKRPKAIKQLLGTLQFLYSIPSIKDRIDRYHYKLCFISASGCPDTDTPRGIAAGFMEIYSHIPDPQPIRNQSIERRGFLTFATNTVRLIR